MNRDTFDQALWKAFRLDFQLCYDFNLEVLHGHYCLSPGAPLQCHPLECVLLGEGAGESVEEDIARRLECTSEFVKGFCAGWAEQSENKKSSVRVSDKDFLAGFKLATSRAFRVF